MRHEIVSFNYDIEFVLVDQVESTTPAYHVPVIAAQLPFQGRNGKRAGIALNDSDNNSKNTQGTGKDFHNQNLDKQAGVLGIGNGTRASGNADTNATGNISETDRETSREHAISGIVIARVVPVLVEVKASVFWLFNLVGQDNGHDDSVNGSGFAENDTELRDNG